MPKPYYSYFLGEAQFLDNEAARCPLCGYQLDGASGLNHNESPSEGDIGVCINCASPLAYNADMTLRVMPQAEIDSLEPELKRMVNLAMIAVRSIDRRKGENK